MDATAKCLGDLSEVIKNNPILSRGAEVALIRTMHARKNPKKRRAAREKLFNSNVRLVLKEAHFYAARCSVPIVDIVSAGMEGLAVAIDKFNPRKFKTKFSTYAIPWIQQRIFRLLKDMESHVYIPRHIVHKSAWYKRVMRECEGQEMPPLSDQEIMDKMGVSKKVLGNIRAARCHSVSLDNSCCYRSHNSSTAHDGELIPYGELISDNKVTTSDLVLIEKERKETINFALSQLTVIQRDIIEKRYLSDEKMDLKDVGKIYKLTGERVRQIEYKALRILRRRFKKFFIKGEL